ncbi:hypothetical protein TcWFU_003720 [Taenia crassiceps]|uniref:Uncharacterized protein n=1 Tax=Taenia crassiceps TaxID=6207 RepID=A0ABR4Q7V1_9CEST
MSTEASDEICLTEDSSICNRTFELLDATFPSLTPVIDRKVSNCDKKDLTSPILDVNGRPRATINYETLFYTPAPTASSYPMATPEVVKGWASTAARSESAFYRRKAYDEARRKSSLSIPRVDPRRRASITAVAVARRERVDAAALRTSKRAEARRKVMSKNRSGLYS